jgi:hypothetical protein
VVELEFAGAVLDLGVTDLGRAEAFTPPSSDGHPIFVRSLVSGNGG